jgi:hypothetical protein
LLKHLQKRFAELAEQMSVVEKTRRYEHSENRRSGFEEVDRDLLLNWRVKARSLISQACGKDSEHFKSFVLAEEYTGYDDSYKVFMRVRAVFGAAREDFEGGYLVSIRNLIHAEIVDSELDQARELLTSGYFSAAAVIAGVVLETTLRSLSDRHGVQHGKLDKMNSDLVKAGAYNSLVQKKVTALAGVRNSAAHGKSSEFSVADVESMIADIERFAQESLS